MQDLSTSSMVTPSVWTEKRPQADGSTKDSILDELWRRFDYRWMDAWSRKFPSQKYIDSWKQALAEDLAAERITGKEFARGCEALRKCKFAPNSAEFLMLCRPTLDPYVAYQEAMSEMPKRHFPAVKDGRLVSEDQWSEPAIFWAAARMWHDLQHCTWKQIQARWERELDKARKEHLIMPPKATHAIEHKPVPSISPAEQQRRIADMIGSLNVRKPPRPDRRDGGADLDRDLEERKRRAEAEVQLAMMQRTKRTAEGA